MRLYRAGALDAHPPGRSHRVAAITAAAGPVVLRRIAAEQLVLVSTGASDWLISGGTAERVEGGYRVSGAQDLRQRLAGR